MKKNIFLLSLTAMMLSCSDTTVPEPEPIPDKWAINIATSITRATDTAFEKGDKVGLYVVNEPNTLRTNGNHVDNVCFTYSGNWTTTTPIYWKDDTTKADFYCYYPYDSNISNVEAYSFGVRANQSSISDYKDSDFLWGKIAKVAPTKESVNITVKHAMSNIVIKLVAGNGYTAEDMANATVTICGLKTNATINFETGEVTAVGSIEEMVPMLEGNQLLALVVPQSVTDTDLIKVTIGDNVYTHNQSIEFKSGKQHTCTLTIERTNQGINIGISGWENDSEDFGGVVE